ncbi:MAG: DUF4139 domain-containing protein, partial [Chloroflexi bacterium]|nr:DUF4139 domain-containing protein [Chloroflexota bacterium]
MFRRIVFTSLAFAFGGALFFASACQGAMPSAPLQTASKAEAKSGGVDLTVYNQNIALVKDKRTLALKAGTNQIRFSDVAAMIDPTSVQFSSLTDPANTRVIEQSYAYDIVGSQKLLQKYLDQTVALTTEDGSKYGGKLLSGADDIILQGDDGQVTSVKLSQVRELKFPQLPGGLITKPTLIWTIESARDGNQDAQVTYLTGGINWRANYVVVVNDKDSAMNLNGWVTIDNNSGAAYEDARLKLVAGDVRRVTQTPQARGLEFQVAPSATAAPKQFAEESFFEYHLYTLQRATTIANRETKQIEFASAANVPITKIFVYDPARAFRFYGYPVSDPAYGKTSDTKIAVMLEFKNSEANKMGMPLPKGTLRVYKADSDGGNQFIGEDEIDHTPKDEMIRLDVGNAFDVVGERTQTNFRKLSERVVEETYQIKIRNHKKETVEVRAVEHLSRWSNWEILNASGEYKKLDSQTIEFRVNVKPDGESVVN